ncbi:Uncharacterized protein APZ42_017477 [Daphnia magna]|uniref:Uncharacterized protein n=1 Tax=Daphnia magna TaxID=35525 RepID=A0A164ZVX9_9CRUS|nr:Uncharacterized protein APZ42_017477 [Daphnia magna]
MKASICHNLGVDTTALVFHAVALPLSHLQHKFTFVSAMEESALVNSKVLCSVPMEGNYGID